MAVSDIEAVVEFLRKNGLCESESALAEDVLEKPELQSFDFEKFLFPMVPPPPPLKISASRGRLGAEAGDGGVEESDGSSEEEFVSLDSSTSDVCSSEFTNPYGIHTTSGVNSQSSSDRLSQFGTAHDYPDFDLQNDLYWYNEKEEHYTLPPYFSGADFFICPSEDKFIMTLETENRIDDGHGSSLMSEGYQTVEKSFYLNKPWHSSFNSLDHVNGAEVADLHHLDKNVEYEVSLEEEKERCTAYSSSIPPYACWAKAGGLFGQDTKDHTLMKLKVAEVNYFKCARSSTNGWAEEFESADDLHMAVGKDLLPNGNDHHQGGHGKEVAADPSGLDNAKDLLPNINGHYEGGNGKGVAGYPNRLGNAANEEEDATADQLLMYDTNEDEYEVFNLRIIHRKNRTGFEENRDFPIIPNSVIAGRYYVMEYLGSAAFSKVVQATDLHTGIDVCLKIIKNNKDFFDQSLDEVKLLKFVNKHDPGDERHILRLYDYFYYQEHLFIVCELLGANLYEYQKYNRESGGKPYFTLSRLQLISRQCLEALEYLHDLGIIHCDLKPENILLKSYRRCEIKVIDLGSSCFQADNLCFYVQSRSYRAPEVILGHPYDHKIDLWSLGCILAELCSGEVLFTNDAIAMLLSHMIGMLGPIDEDMLVRGQETHKYFTEDYDLYVINEETNQLEYIIPKKSSLEHHLQVSDNGFIDFMRYLLEINPQRRPTAREALEHPWLSHQYELSS